MEKTEELMEQAKQKATAVISQASDVIGGAKSFTQASDQQLEALRKGKSIVAEAMTTAEEAFAALRCCWLVSVVCLSLLVAVVCMDDGFHYVCRLSLGNIEPMVEPPTYSSESRQERTHARMSTQRYLL